MNQGITVGQSFIKFLDNNLPSYSRENPALKCLELLEQNHFVIDQKREIYKSYLNEIEKISNHEKRKYFAETIQAFIEKRKIELINYSDKKEGSVSSIYLCSSSKDNILLDNNYDELEEIELRKKELSLLNKHGKIEIHNSKTFLTPTFNQRLKHLPTTIILKKEEEYDLRLLFKPFVRNAKEIIIEDPYIRNEYALKNLKYLLPIFQNSKVTIKTYEEEYHKYLKQVDKNLFDKFVESKKGNISLVFYKKASHKERFIITDKVEIYLPGGLDRFRDGMPKMSNEDSGRFKIRIEKRES